MYDGEIFCTGSRVEVRTAHAFCVVMEFAWGFSWPGDMLGYTWGLYFAAVGFRVDMTCYSVSKMGKTPACFYFSSALLNLALTSSIRAHLFFMHAFPLSSCL